MNWWIIYALLSAVFASLVAVFGKLGLKGVDATLATTIRAVIMPVFLIITSISLGKIDVTGFNNKIILFIILSGICGAISWIFYFLALKIGPTSGVASLDRLSVVFVFIFAILFLGEQFTWKSLAGAILVTMGAIIMAL